MRLCFTGNPGSIHTQRWVGHFAQAGHEVHLINLGPQPAWKFDWPGPQHHNLPAPPVAPIPGLRGILMLTARRRALIALLRQIQPDVLHAQSVADPGWFAALSGFHPLVLTAWGSDVLLGLHRGPRLHRWLTRNALRHADLLTADARSVLDAARPHLRPGARVELIRFGVDTRAFSPGVDTTWRARLALGAGPVLLSIRQCHPLYNIDVIIRAFARVHGEIPAARLLVKLVSQDANDPYLAEMRALANEFALGDAVVYVPQVAYADIPDLYRAADVVLSVPSSDGLPVSVLEAMACGTPVIASDLPALRELADDGADLSLVPARDVEALSRAIMAILADPVRKAQVVEQNLATVRRTGDFGVEMARMEQLYHSLSQGTGSRG
jgi:glycosyltransferase involved in cell wall biosynthesis